MLEPVSTRKSFDDVRGTEDSEKDLEKTEIKKGCWMI